MVHYKLIYFNLRARGELIRLILKHQNVPFEDFRIELKDWPNHKAGREQIINYLLHSCQ